MGNADRHRLVQPSLVMNITAPISRLNRAARLNRNPNSQSSSGFTLIELLVSIAVISVLAALGLPQLNGLYEHQKLTNSANELVTHIKSLQNKALANNQDKFTISEASGGPLIDCLPSPDSKPYVDGYKLSINADGRGYETAFKFRSHNKAGVACPTAPSVNDRISTVLLPAGIIFGGGETNKSILYCVVTGRIVFDGGDCNDPTKAAEELTLSNERLPSGAHSYHICINQGRAYVKTTSCP